MSIIKVERQMDDIWEVVEYEDYYHSAQRQVLHQGTLVECEAFLRLREGGYLIRG